MHYIDNKTLEILTALIITKKEVEVDSFWLETPSNFFGEIKRLNCVSFIKTETKFLKTSISIRNEQGLENFLKQYLLMYKEGTLEDDRDIDYFSYLENLQYMKTLFNIKSSNFEKSRILIDSVEARNGLVEHPYRNKRARVLEFLLEVFFELKIYADFENCRIQKNNNCLITYRLLCNLNLKESPQKICQALLEFYHFSNLPKDEYCFHNLKYDKKRSKILVDGKEADFTHVASLEFKMISELIQNPDNTCKINDFYLRHSDGGNDNYKRFKERQYWVNQKLRAINPNVPLIKIQGKNFYKLVMSEK